MCVHHTKIQLFHVFVNTLSPVFLGLPRSLPFTLSNTILLHAVSQSSGSLRSTCPNHLNLPRLTTSETLSMPSRLNCSAFAYLSLSFTLHLIIILSVLSSLCISSAFIAHVSLPYTNKFLTQVGIKLFLSASVKPSLP